MAHMQFSNKLFFSYLIGVLLIACNDTYAKEDLWNAEQYVQNSDPQYQWATSYIQKMQLQGEEKILDIGCGDGRITAILARSVPHGFVMGVDASESMIQAAKKLPKMDNLQFAQKDARLLDFHEEFDWIVSFSCLHWVQDHKSALAEIEKALKPNGRVFLYFAPDHGRPRFDLSIQTVMKSPTWSKYFSHFVDPFCPISAAKFATYAEETSLLFERMEIVTVDQAFQDKEAFIAWMTGWMSHLQHVPKPLQQEFLEDIVDHYIQRHPLDAEGKFHYVDYWLEVKLLKRR